MKEFERIVGYSTFKKGYEKLLETTLSEFFSADVSVICNPIVRFSRDFDIDIRENEKREVYFPDSVSNNTALLVVRVVYNKEYYFLGIVIKLKLIRTISKALNCTVKALASTLNLCASSYFTNAYHLLDESLANEIITRIISVGYNPYRIKYLIRYLLRLRSTTFEGKYFSSGLIVVRSRDCIYKDLISKGKGTLINLTKRVSIFDPINNRDWFLSDGIYSFYLLTANQGYIKDVFIPSYNASDFLSQSMLKSAVWGHDLLFRIENGRDLSIITSKGIEIINQENTWRYRDYGLLYKVIKECIDINDEVFQSLLYFILYCSKNDTSSIIWLPVNSDEDTIHTSLKNINIFGKPSLNLTNRAHTGIIKRFISSDGVTVIKDNGAIVGFGGIVDNSSLKVTGKKGTGETAAKLLAKNGLAIKISQDGTIKVFYNGTNNPLKF